MLFNLKKIIAFRLFGVHPPSYPPLKKFFDLLFVLRYNWRNSEIIYVVLIKRMFDFLDLEYT